jgi:hypothetical protein
MDPTSTLVPRPDNKVAVRAAKVNKELSKQGPISLWADLAIGLINLLIVFVITPGIDIGDIIPLILGGILTAVGAIGLPVYYHNRKTVRRAIESEDMFMLSPHIRIVWEGIVESNAELIRESYVDFPIWREVCKEHLNPVDASQLVHWDSERVKPHTDETTAAACETEINRILTRLFHEVMEREQLRQFDKIFDRRERNERLRNEAALQQPDEPPAIEQ